MAGSASDAFQAVIDKLNALATSTTPLASKVDQVNSDLDSLNSFLSRVQNLNSELADAKTAINDVKDICLALVEIPVVGEITEPVADALSATSDMVDTVSKPIAQFVTDFVTPAQDLLGTLKTGTGKVDTVLNDISNDIPVFTNTLALLQSLATIADSLVAALAGTDLANRLAALEAEYDALRGEVDAGVASIDSVTQTLANAVDTVAQALSSTLQIGSSLDSAISNVEKVTQILDPIKSALDTVENAIAPVKWALDAAACVFDTVFKPVLYAVMDATGLQSLFNGLAQKLEDALGITDLVNGLTNALHIQVLSDFESQIKGDAGSAAATLLQGWAGVESALAKYKTGDQARDEAIKEFVSVISGAPPGTDPSVVPEWPLPTQPYAPPADVSAKPSAYSAQFASANAGLAALVRAQSMMRAFAALPSGAVVVAASPPLGPQWNDVTVLQGGIALALDAIAGFKGTPVTLSEKYSAFKQTTGLPEVLSDQLGDIIVSLKAGSDLIKLVDGFAIMKGVFTPIGAALDDQLALCAQGSASIAQLHGNVGNVSDGVDAAIVATPSPAVLSDAAARLAGWAYGATMLAGSIDQARTVKQTPTSPADLDAKTAQLNARCAALLAMVRAITTSIAAAEQQAALIDQQLEQYGQSLTQIGQHGQLMSAQGQATADQVAHLAAVIDSLLDPLSLIAQQLNCTVAAPTKTAANGALQLLSAACVTGSKNAKSKLEELLDGAFVKVLPIAALGQDAAKANTVISDAMAAQFVSASGLLAAAMKDLAANLQNTCTYSFSPKPGAAPAPIDNQFLDQATGASTIALYQSLSA